MTWLISGKLAYYYYYYYFRNSDNDNTDNVVFHEFPWIRRTHDYIQLNAYHCMLSSSRV